MPSLISTTVIKFTRAPHLIREMIASGRFELVSLLHWSKRNAKSNHFARLGGRALSLYLCCIHPEKGFQNHYQSTISDACVDGVFARTSVALIRKGCQT